MVYPIKLSKDKYHKAVIKIIACFLNLTDFEVDVITTMLKYNIHSITTDTRIIVRNHLGKDTYTFNNYIKRLKDKRALIVKDGELVILPSIIKCIQDKEINIKFDVDTDIKNNNTSK